jgi:signal transduction histidine kinase
VRDRLVVAFLAVTLAAVTVLLVERTHATAALVHADEQRQVERSATAIAEVVAGAPARVTPALLRGQLLAGEHIVYVDAGGGRVEAARPSGRPESRAADDLTATRPLPGGATLTVARDAGIVQQRLADSLLRLVLVALAVLLLAGLAAWLLAHRLSRPFVALAEAAGRIGRGDFVVEVPRSTVPEADAVARTLRASAEDLSLLVQRERDFAAHGSHALRTPLTAARLELEELALSPQSPPEVVSRASAALGQLDRLSSTVAQLLDDSHESRLGNRVDIDLGALVRDSVSRWQQLAPSRAITASSAEVVPLRMPAGALIQVLDILIGNAVTHGEGRVAVDIAEAPAYVELRISDGGARHRTAEGIGNPVAERAGGLATATQIAGSLGGRLRLTDEVRTSFSLVLPRSPRETVGR